MAQNLVEDAAQGQDSGALTGDLQSRWHWISDRQSAENGDISVLAIIETILAGILAYLFYRWTNTHWHVGLAACLSPFLLLRTPRNIELSLRIAAKFFGVSVNDKRQQQQTPPYSENVSGVLFTITPPVIGVIKFCTFFLCFITHPIESIREIPRNWRRVVFCTDIGSIPELIPTIEQVPEDNPLDEIKSSRALRFVIGLLPIMLDHYKTEYRYINYEDRIRDEIRLWPDYLKDEYYKLIKHEDKNKFFSILKARIRNNDFNTLNDTYHICASSHLSPTGC